MDIVNQVNHVKDHAKLKNIKGTGFVMMETIIVDVNMMVEIVVILMLIRIGVMSVNALTQVHHLAHVKSHAKMRVIKETIIVMMETIIVDVIMMVEIVVFLMIPVRIIAMIANARNKLLSLNVCAFLGKTFRIHVLL